MHLSRKDIKETVSLGWALAKYLALHVSSNYSVRLTGLPKSINLMFTRYCIKSVF